MGSFGHSNSKGLVLFLLKVLILKAFVFFWFNHKPDNTPNEFIMFSAFLSDLVSSRMSVVSSVNCEILAICPCIQELNSPTKLILAYFNPFAPRDFAEKRILKRVEWFSGHCRAIKS